MAKNAGSLEIGMEFPELTELREQFKQLPTNIAAKHLGAALRAAMKPGVAILRAGTPRGPTGNLRKSIKLKIKTYPKQGNAVGIVGYSWGGDSKGYHQGFLEFGTKDRKTKGRFASRWKYSQFSITNPTRGKNAGKLVTRPKPPVGFFKSAKEGEVVNLGRMPIGGRTGVPPVKTAFAKSQGQMKSLLQEELSTRLEKAINEVKGRVARGLIT